MSVVILIPAYKPGKNFIPYVRELAAHSFDRIVVVDDGSGREYGHIFAELKTMPQCTVLQHDVNMGKGCALKTGYKLIIDKFRDAKGVITADCDGQHSVQDVARMAHALQGAGDSLVLGCRDLKSKSVPLRSRFGNRLTIGLFALLYGKKVSDTQTGLRAMPLSLLPFMLEIKGERYEYEMNVLVRCRMHKIPIVEIPIETIYINDNSDSHFDVIRDSARIYKILLGTFFLFSASSALCAVIDIGVFALMSKAVFSEEWAHWLLFSTATARVISSLVNFLLNRSVVFRDGDRSSILRYYMLAAGQMLASWLLVSGIYALLAVEVVLVKVVVDVCLFFISYRIQRAWVFKRGKKQLITENQG